VPLYRVCNSTLSLYIPISIHSLYNMSSKFTIEFYCARADACSRSPKLLYAVYILVAVAILTDSQIKSWV
jgi:hypothetical protein